MSQVFRLKMAKQTAEALLKQEGITSLPVDPFALAGSRNRNRWRRGHSRIARDHIRCGERWSGDLIGY